MEALRFIETVHNGGIYITLPKEFNEQEMELIIKPLYKKKQEPAGLTPLEIAKQFAQKVNPLGRKIDLSKFDVYDQ
jgi:hypothetical protein